MRIIYRLFLKQGSSIISMITIK